MLMYAILCGDKNLDRISEGEVRPVVLKWSKEFKKYAIHVGDNLKGRYGRSHCT